MKDRYQKASPLQAGAVLDGKYEILRTLGAGATGVVFEAVHLGINRRLAIKVLNDTAVEDAENVERFRREALITGSLGHENIIRVTDVGVTDNGAPYIVMEYLEGESLHDYLHGRDPLPIAEAIELMVHVLDALTAVHAAGVVHRDLKPDNIFLARQCVARHPDKTVVKVLDFGISRACTGLNELGRLTGSGFAIGTPQYMAPEQIKAKEVDHQADIYAAGLILFGMLTGRLPYKSRNIASYFGIVLTNEPPSPATFRAEISDGLAEIVLRAIARKKTDRFATAADFLYALESFSAAADQRESSGASISPAPESDDPTGISPQQKNAPLDVVAALAGAPNGSASTVASSRLTPRSRRGAWTVAAATLLLLAAAAMVSVLDDDGGTATTAPAEDDGEAPLTARVAPATPTDPELPVPRASLGEPARESAAAAVSVSDESSARNTPMAARVGHLRGRLPHTKAHGAPPPPRLSPESAPETHFTEAKRRIDIAYPERAESPEIPLSPHQDVAEFIDVEYPE